MAENFEGLLNGTEAFDFNSLRLEGLHYAHVGVSERYAIADGAFSYGAAEPASLNRKAFAARAMNGLLLAHKTVVFNSFIEAITAKTNDPDAILVSKRYAQLFISAIVATGTGLSGGVTTFSHANIDAAFVTSYSGMYGVENDAASVKNDVVILSKQMQGFEAVNEAFSNWLHTNHHNKSASRFEKGVCFAFLSVASSYKPAAVPNDQANFPSSWNIKDVVVGSSLRLLIHDADHKKLFKWIVEGEKGSAGDFNYPMTDFNRFSAANAPAGISHISAAVSILESAGKNIHTEYAKMAEDLKKTVPNIEVIDKAFRYRFSPFYTYLTGEVIEKVPIEATVFVAHAGALAKIAQTQEHRDILIFLQDSPYAAVAVLKHSTSAAVAAARRRLDIVALAAASKSSLVTSSQVVKDKVSAIIEAELEGLIL